METLKEVRDWAIAANEDESMNEEIDRWINDAVIQCGKLARFRVLRDFLDLTTDASGDIIIPAYVDRINEMWKDTTIPHADLPFAQRLTEPNDFEVRIKQPYYIPQGMDTTAQTNPIPQVTVNSTALTIVTPAATWFVAADVGKAVTFASHGFVYEITAVDVGAETASIFPSYRESTNTTTGSTATTPPEGQTVLRFYNNDDSVYASSAVHIEYQRKHPRLFSDNDRIYFDCPKTLRILVEQEMLAQGKYDRDAQALITELEFAKHAELADELQSGTQTLPQGIGKLGPLFGRGSRRSQPGTRLPSTRI